MPTTHRNYIASDRTAVAAALNAQLSTAYMQANVSTNWRGWRDEMGALELGATGPVQNPACGALWFLLQPRPPAVVQDQDAPSGRWYTLRVDLRTQLDPLPSVKFYDDFDATIKDRLEAVWDADSGKTMWSGPRWVHQDTGTTSTGDSWYGTAHFITLQMGD